MHIVPGITQLPLVLKLEGESTLSERDAGSVQELAFAWDLPSLTEKNRRWIFEKLLIHAVSESLRNVCFQKLQVCFFLSSEWRKHG